jgi:hypothetical protein
MPWVALRDRFSYYSSHEKKLRGVKAWYLALIDEVAATGSAEQFPRHSLRGTVTFDTHILVYWISDPNRRTPPHRALHVSTLRQYHYRMDDLVFNATYDDEARVWFVSDNTLGIVTEADTLEVLEYKLQTMVPEFADLNNVILPRPIKFSLHAEKATVAFA